ncbi:glycosyltransferase family 4 protein [Desulfocurvus sp. DL9XJH121]
MTATGAPIPVLHVAGGLGLGGTEKTLQLLVCHLDRSRFAPAVFAFADGPRRAALTSAGIDVHVGDDLLRVLQRLRPEIVHLHRPGWPQPGVLRALRLAGVPHVVETNVFGRFDPSPQAAVIDRHLFVSDFCLRRYGAMNGVDVSGPRHRVLYNPVDTGRFSLWPRHRDPARPSVGRVSRADPGKWSPLALAMLPHLARQVPDFTYRVIGGTPEAREWVRSHGLDAHVEFLDPVLSDDELAAYFETISVLAHANDTGESFGMVIAEAMAAGLPVVTHPCPEPRDNAQLELVEYGRTGLVATSAEEYAGAVAWLLDNPDRAREMGAAGRARAQRLFNVRSIAKQLESIYEELILERTSHPGRPHAHAPLQAVHGSDSRL